jgi:hypothetical protein
VKRSEQCTWQTDESTEWWYSHRRLLARWREIDTDWKSIFVATTIVALVVGFDVPVPA